MIVRHIDRDGHVRRHYIGVTYVRSISDCMLYLTKTEKYSYVGEEVPEDYRVFDRERTVAVIHLGPGEYLDIEQEETDYES